MHRLYQDDAHARRHEHLHAGRRHGMSSPRRSMTAYIPRNRYACAPSPTSSTTKRGSALVDDELRPERPRQEADDGLGDAADADDAAGQGVLRQAGRHRRSAAPPPARTAAPSKSPPPGRGRWRRRGEQKRHHRRLQRERDEHPSHHRRRLHFVASGLAGSDLPASGAAGRFEHDQHGPQGCEVDDRPEPDRPCRARGPRSTCSTVAIGNPRG